MTNSILPIMNHQFFQYGNEEDQIHIDSIPLPPGRFFYKHIKLIIKLSSMIN